MQSALLKSSHREPHPTVFTLEHFGLNRIAVAAAFRASFERLPWDTYDVRREQIAILERVFPAASAELKTATTQFYLSGVQSPELNLLIHHLPIQELQSFYTRSPKRRKRVSRFAAYRNHLGSWEFTETEIVPIAQAVGGSDIRSIPREYEGLEEEVVESAVLKQIFNGAVALVTEYRPEASELEIHCWQVGLVSWPGVEASNSPEGIHQDGADYIVSALVLERRNIVGGESIVYWEDKKTELLRHTLQTGEGLFQPDSHSPLWHTVTPIQVADPVMGPGIRNILGFDLNVKG